MQADGTQQVNQTRNPAFDIDPDWQPLPIRHGQSPAKGVSLFGVVAVTVTPRW